MIFNHSTFAYKIDALKQLSDVLVRGAMEGNYTESNINGDGRFEFTDKQLDIITTEIIDTVIAQIDKHMPDDHERDKPARAIEVLLASTCSYAAFLRESGMTANAVMSIADVEISITTKSSDPNTNKELH